MKVGNNPQPDWLRNMIYGYSKFETWRILVDGIDFAVVQVPGGKYQSGQEQKYGSTCYYLVYKKCDPRTGHALHEWNPLQDGGRVGKKKLAEWKALVDKSDALGTYADEETKSLILENIVDGLSVFLDTHLTEAQYRHDTGGMTMCGKSKDYWAGQIEAHKTFKVKLKTLAPGLIKDETKA